MNIQSIILFLITGVLFISCTKEEINNPSEYKDGDTTPITLTLKSERQQLNEMQGMAQANRAMQFPCNVPTTANMIGNKTFSPKDESLITNVHILVFNSTGQIVSNTYINKLNFSETAKIITETYCGENMDVWVVANGDVNDTKEDESKVKLEKVKNVNDLQAILISTNGDGLSRSDRLTMVGNTTITITPNMAAISIQMHYLAAKVTVKVNVTDTPSDVAITITGWDVVNIPKRTYLKEHTKEDAVSGTESTDYLYSAEEYPFETIGADTKTWAQSFYLFENRRGGRIDRTLPTNPAERYPNMAFEDTDPRGKAWFAPPGATYMLIYGTYNKSGQINNVVYKIYLGENAYNNYDVIRGKHYTFNVTIKGLNQIDIDTTVDWGNSSFMVTPYGDLEKMDAHPDFRVLRIGATAVDVTTPGYAAVEVLNNDNSPCQWLTVSPLNLYRYGIKQADNKNQPFDDADAVGCFVQTKYDPIVTDKLSFDRATFGMTRKLTEIPFSQLAVFTFQDIVVYADEFDDTSGTGERKAKVRVTYYDNNNPSQAIGQFEFPVAQQGAFKISDELYMERYEEVNMWLQPGYEYYQGGNAAKIQWGYSGQVLYGNQDRYTNGNYLTANAVYNHLQTRNGMDAPTWKTPTYDKYRIKYPLAGAPITEPATGVETESVYYYPVLTAKTARTTFFDPIYNSSAARYCHEKNRDTNGNGVIDADEAVWYLPSLADMVAMKGKLPTGVNLLGYYWTSTEEDNDNSWSYSVGYSKSQSSAKTDRYWVRCIKGKGAASLPEPDLSTYDGNTMSFTNAGGIKSITIQDRTGLPWTVTSSATQWLKFSESNVGGGVANSYSGTGNRDYYVHATTNSNTTNRTATITLTRRDTPKSEVITVTQAGATPVATIDKTRIELNFLGDEPIQFNIDNKNTGLTWTVISNQDWLKIVQDPQSDNRVSKFSASGSATLYAVCSSTNPNNSARTGTLTLSRSLMPNITITVTQKATPFPYQPTQHKGWAGCNIYWDAKNNRLTFDDVGVTTRADYQGVAFAWGSLGALSPQYPYNPPGGILFIPKALPPNYNYFLLPVVKGQSNSSNTNENRHYLLEGHDPENNIGDICRYITKRGWAPGAANGKKWRLPTCNEMRYFQSYSTPTDNSLYMGTNKDGSSVIPKGKIKNGFNPSLPANGWFEMRNGSLNYGWNAGHEGTYWTSTAWNETESILLYFNGQNNISPQPWGRNLTLAAGVRCVLE